MSSIKQEVSKSLLIFGVTGSFKTTEAARFARYIYRTTGKATRMVSADGGGWTPAQPEIDAGIIIPWRVTSINNALPVIRKLVKGWWPEVIGGKLQLVGPTAETWKQIGGYIFEGLTSLAFLCMRDLKDHQRKIGQDVVGAFVEDNAELGLTGENSEKFCAPGQTHYGFTQFEAYDWVQAANMLPVSRVLWTALEYAGEEEDTRNPIRGPQVIGKAATPNAPSWFGTCIHMEQYQTPKDVVAKSTGSDGKVTEQKLTVMETLVRAWFVKHADAKFMNITYPAKPRVPVEQIPALMKKFPGGFYVPDFVSGIDKFLEAEDELLYHSASSAATWKESVDKERSGAGSSSPSLVSQKS